jgi:hypothetical protein
LTFSTTQHLFKKRYFCLITKSYFLKNTNSILIENLMSKTRFNLSLESGTHKQLNTLVGNWAGTTYTWLEPEQRPEISTTTGTIRTLAESRFILYEYIGSCMGEPRTGAMVFGYDLARKIFQSIWMDTFHTETGIISANGEMTDGIFSTQGKFGSPSTCATWCWLTEISLIKENTLLITSFTISPENVKHKIIESRLERQ